VHLKLDGHTMTGIGFGTPEAPTTGVAAINGSRVHLQGPGTITGYGEAVLFGEVDSSDVNQVTMTGSGRVGMRVVRSNQIQINNNVADGNNGIGIVLNDSSDNQLAGNTADDNLFNGIFIDFGSTGNVIHGNTALGNGEFDLFDDNPNCDANKWSGNHFNTAFAVPPSCIS
jgi:parallel beta-helix repeat protein